MNSLTEILYSGYYPDIEQKKVADDAYSLSNPFNNNGSSLKIDSGGSFWTSDDRYSGFFTDFQRIAEGISKEDAFICFSNLRSGVKPPDLVKIKMWNDDIFLPENKDALNYLMLERGLDEKTIRRHLIGFDATYKRLTFPILNITGCNTSYIKYFPLDNVNSVKKDKISSEGGDRLLGYHDLKFSPNYNTTKYIVFDEFDALLLGQNGYESFCPMSSDRHLNAEWIDLFQSQEVILIVTDETEPIAKEFQKRLKDSTIKIVNLGVKFLSDYIKNGKTIDDLNAEIEKARKLDENYLRNEENFKKLLESEVLIPKHNGAQDYVNGRLYYGIKTGDDVLFLSSEEGLLDLDQIKTAGINPHGNFTESKVTHSLVEKHIKGCATISASALFTRIRNYIQKYVFIKETSAYDLLSIWVMGTYVFRIFGYYPYIHLQAEKDSGKTVLIQALMQICFNGSDGVDQTGATIFRQVEANSPTLFLDEVEDFKNPKPSQRNIMSILNVGFSKSGKVSRVIKEPVSFSVYSPKVFGGINDINDVLESRTIHIPMLRKLPEEKIEKFNDSKDLLAEQEAIREALYLFGLQFCGAINDLYGNIQSIKYLDELQNRAADIWGPLFVLSSIVDQANGNSVVSDSLKTYLDIEQEVHKIRDEEENETSIMLNVLNEVLNSIKPVKVESNSEGTVCLYLTDDVFDFFAKSKAVSKTIKTKHRLTSILRKKIGIGTKNITINEKTRRTYVIGIEKLQDFALRYNYTLEFEQGSIK